MLFSAITTYTRKKPLSHKSSIVDVRLNSNYYPLFSCFKASLGVVGNMM